jgi:hypothetical protein
MRHPGSLEEGMVKAIMSSQGIGWPRRRRSVRIEKALLRHDVEEALRVHIEVKRKKVDLPQQRRDGYTAELGDVEVKHQIRSVQLNVPVE